MSRWNARSILLAEITRSTSPPFSTIILTFTFIYFHFFMYSLLLSHIFTFICINFHFHIFSFTLTFTFLDGMPVQFSWQRPPAQQAQPSPLLTPLSLSHIFTFMYILSLSCIYLLTFIHFLSIHPII